MAPEPVGGWGEFAPSPPPPQPRPTATGRTAADVLDDTFRAVRGALPTLLVAAGTTVALLGLVNLVVLLPVGARLSGVHEVAGASLDPDLAAEAVWLTGVGESATRVLVLAGALLVSGVLAPACAAGLLGRPTDPGRLWQQVRGRLLPLLVVAVVPTAAVVAAAALGAVPGVAVAVLAARSDDLQVLDGGEGLGDGERLGDGAAVSGVLVGAGLALAGAMALGAAVLLTLGVRWCLAPQAVVLERLGVRAALRRSRSLTSGSYWRSLGVVAFAVVLTWVVHALVSAPFAAVGAVVGASRHADVATLLGLAAGQLALSAVGAVVAAAASYPLLAAALTVLFDDLRGRQQPPP